MLEGVMNCTMILISKPFAWKTSFSLSFRTGVMVVWDANQHHTKLKIQ